jgi:hypothetical protein
MPRYLLTVTLALLPTIAFAQSGVQWTRGRDATLISKDVGDERWSITRRLSDGRVTGNVFRNDGGSPAFLDCAETAEDGTTVTLDCYASGPAPETYGLIASGVQLPVSFFFPPGEAIPPQTLENMVGSWRVEVDSPGSGGPGIWNFNLSTIVGSELRGFNQFGDVATVMRIGDNPAFRLTQPLIGVCGVFEFSLTGPDRIDGVTWGVLKDGSGRCTTQRGGGATGQDKAFVGFRE